MRVSLIIGICFTLILGNVLAQDSTKNTPTFHIKTPFDQRNAVVIEITCDISQNGDYKETYKKIVISKNGDAYLYWANGNYRWDSVSVYSDTVLTNKITRIVTPLFIKTTGRLDVDVWRRNEKDTTAVYEYRFAIIENALVKVQSHVLVNHFSNRSKKAGKKLAPLLGALEEVYRKYPRPIK
jgi:hypothetical protein